MYSKTDSGDGGKVTPLTKTKAEEVTDEDIENQEGRTKIQLQQVHKELPSAD